jgi:hypothetical protein
MLGRQMHQRDGDEGIVKDGKGENRNNGIKVPLQP